jgi:hypothetical protein
MILQPNARGHARGLGRYLPLHKVGKLCIWDVAAIAGIVFIVFNEWRYFARIKSSS